MIAFAQTSAVNNNARANISNIPLEQLLHWQSLPNNCELLSLSELQAVKQTSVRASVDATAIRQSINATSVTAFSIYFPSFVGPFSSTASPSLLIYATINTIVFIMALDCGFDIFPHLVPTEENKILYREFLDKVLTFDTKLFPFVLPAEVECPETFSKKFIHFLIPGQPKIPLGDNCDCFLSFRSNDALSADVLNIIRAMAVTARQFFGSRVHFWKGQSDFYNRGDLRRAEEEVERRPEYKLDKIDDIGTKDEPDMPADTTKEDV